MSRPVIRKGTPDDVAPLLEMLAIHALPLMPGADKFDAASSEAFIAGNIGTSIIAEADGQIVGCLLMQISATWYSKQRFMRGMGIFVRPDARAAWTGYRIMKAALRAARRYELPFVLVVTSGGDILRKDAFFRRLGMTAIGGTYIYEA